MNTPSLPKPFALTGFDLLLYAAVIWGWSTSWYAITHHLVMAPEAAVFWRFLLTAPVMFALARWRGERLAFGWKAHLGLALSGVLMFSTNFILFYHAGMRLPSGLSAVVFSLASILNFILGMVLFGEAFRWRLALGGLLGFLGIGALFLPRLVEQGVAAGTGVGLMLAIAGTTSFSLGNQTSSRLQKSGLGVLASSAWGMVYGSGFCALYTVLRGESFAAPMTLGFWGAMAFLIFSATVLAFYAYLTLVGRIGAARASYATVIFPIFALMISAAFEGYQWTWLAAFGLVLAIAGNLLVLRRD